MAELNQLLSTSMFFLVENMSHEPVGFVYAYNTSHIDGFTSVTVQMEPGARGRGFGAEAMIILLEYLFNYFSFRKVYVEVYEFNQASLSSLQNAGFKEEGRFEDYLWYGDRYWTLHRLSLTRESALQFKQRFESYFWSKARPRPAQRTAAAFGFVPDAQERPVRPSG